MPWMGHAQEVAIFCDVSMAFDYVRQNILFQKL